ncbi:hypothetical protein P7C70_g6294, partial [Phenoliferia sp. Uapishka_3]
MQSEATTRASTLAGDEAWDLRGPGATEGIGHKRERDEDGGGDAHSERTRFSHDEERAVGGGKEGGKSEREGDGNAPIWVEWEEGDVENPFNWTLRRRWLITVVSCAYAFTTAFAGTGFSMGINTMKRELDCSSELASMGLAAFPLGFAVAPLVLAPFSEAYGRYWMYCITATLYTIFLIPIARAPTISVVIVFRLMAGLACSSGNTMVGGTIADLFEASNRGM